MGVDSVSVCMFMASDVPLPEFAPACAYPLKLDIDTGTVYDGGADDNYYLSNFANVGDYTHKKYGVCLDWRYTEGRAERIIAYIKNALQKSDVLEFWHVWLMDYYEFEDRPFIHRKTVSVEELTAAHIQEMDQAVIWNTPDKMYPERPSFYCLTITG